MEDTTILVKQEMQAEGEGCEAYHLPRLKEETDDSRYRYLLTLVKT
jgi:hypothetical protein